PQRAALDRQHSGKLSGGRMMELLLKGAMVGCIATIVLDLWAIVAKNLLKIPPPSWPMVGRWIGHMKNGTFIHRPISNSSAITGEAVIGWGFHYAIGIAYGVAYLAILNSYFGGQVSLIAALLLAWALLVAPWCVMQPGLGAGLFARKAPKPNLMRAGSFMGHSVFGLGLYLGTKLLVA
ncbi:MAG: DUF2938 family protein, partial [Pseudomonadota bacterium]